MGCRTNTNPWLLALIAASLTASVQADIAKLDAAKDNTLYEDAAGSLSNGSGQHTFAGNNFHASKRRALIEFDCSSIPAGSVVTSVALRLSMSMTAAGPQSVALRRVLMEWGEGASEAVGGEGSGIDAAPPDATWLHTMTPSSLWATKGGDFAATASATVSVGGNGFYTWGSTAAMVADVQAWVDDPAANHGWALIGNESGVRTAKRFDSRENELESNRPVLSVEYTPPAGCPIDYVPDGTIDFLDYLEFLNLYDAQDPLADLNRDGTVDFSDYLEFLNSFDGGC